MLNKRRSGEFGNRNSPKRQLFDFFSTSNSMLIFSSASLEAVIRCRLTYFRNFVLHSFHPFLDFGFLGFLFREISACEINHFAHSAVVHFREWEREKHRNKAASRSMMRPQAMKENFSRTVASRTKLLVSLVAIDEICESSVRFSDINPVSIPFRVTFLRVTP